MPRSRNDAYKRNCAQAMNHMMSATLDVNNVYTVFDSQFQMLANKAAESGDPQDAANAERYHRMTEELKTIMMGIYACNQHLILFVQEAWGLDEETIKVYLR